MFVHDSDPIKWLYEWVNLIVGLNYNQDILVGVYSFLMAVNDSRVILPMAFNNKNDSRPYQNVINFLFFK